VFSFFVVIKDYLFVIIENLRVGILLGWGRPGDSPAKAGIPES